MTFARWIKRICVGREHKELQRFFSFSSSSSHRIYDSINIQGQLASTRPNTDVDQVEIYRSLSLSTAAFFTTGTRILSETKSLSILIALFFGVNRDPIDGAFERLGKGQCVLIYRSERWIVLQAHIWRGITSTKTRINKEMDVNNPRVSFSVPRSSSNHSVLPNEQLIRRKRVCGGGFLLQTCSDRKSLPLTSQRTPLTHRNESFSSPTDFVSPKIESDRLIRHGKTFSPVRFFFVQRFHWLWKFDHNKSIAEFVGCGNHWYS